MPKHDWHKRAKRGSLRQRAWHRVKAALQYDIALFLVLVTALFLWFAWVHVGRYSWREFYQ